MNASAQDPLQRVGAVLDGRFRLDKLLGAGGMGAVYVATAADGGRCAIKLLLNETGNTDFLARFQREGQLAASLHAPNVARVHELAVDRTLGIPFIVMELLDGNDVEQLVERVGPVHPTTAVRITLQAAAGLVAAHAGGIVHRDVKPANVFLDRTANGIAVKVCDFGIAKAVLAGQEAMTATGSMLGSPLYMSPEQIRDSKHVDVRTDVWSLAMSLWTMLTGKAAFEHVSSLGELMVSITTRPIPWVQDFAPWIDPALARVLNGALLSDLTMRCPSMEALVEGLTPFAGGSVALTEADLVGVPTSMRQTAASRGAPGQSWSDSLPQDGAASATTDASLQALVGQTLAGRYRLDRVLGSGGMGAVYEATNATGQRVAVKVLLGDAERQRPEVLRRFVREAKATLAVDSPHVVRILEVDADPQRSLPFIVMELLSGTDLDKLVKQRGALEPSAVVKAFQHACAGLSAVHARGIVHRDIKPANLFLHDAGGGRLELKICDFGIAKQEHTDTEKTSTELTRTGGMLGSPMYMSPEQARSAKHVDHTSDIWGLGVTLYEALSGRRPWEGCTTVGDLIIAICTQELPHLQEVAPWIEPGLADAVHRAIQRDPKARYASMDAFGVALAPFAGPGGPLLASSLVPVSTTVRARSAPRSSAFASTTAQGVSSVSSTGTTAPSRGRGLVIGLLACVVVVLAGVSLLVWKMRKDQLALATPPAVTVDTPKPDVVPSALPSAAPVAKTEVTVRVTPAEATVTVDGKPRPLVAGAFTLEGEPGDTFHVVAKVAARTEAKDIVVGKKPSTETVEVPPDPKAGRPKVPAGTKPHTTAATPTAAPTTTGAPIGASTF